MFMFIWSYKSPWKVDVYNRQNDGTNSDKPSDEYFSNIARQRNLFFSRLFLLLYFRRENRRNRSDGFGEYFAGSLAHKKSEVALDK